MSHSPSLSRSLRLSHFKVAISHPHPSPHTHSHTAPETCMRTPPMCQFSVFNHLVLSTNKDKTKRPHTRTCTNTDCGRQIPDTCSVDDPRKAASVITCALNCCCSCCHGGGGGSGGGGGGRRSSVEPPPPHTRLNGRIPGALSALIHV